VGVLINQDIVARAKLQLISYGFIGGSLDFYDLIKY